MNCVFQNGSLEWNFRMEVHSRVEYLRGTKWPLWASVGLGIRTILILLLGLVIRDPVILYQLT